jgi:hypothetical protein
MIPLIDLLADPGAPVAPALRDDVRFRSPYADYTGRADVAHLVDLIRRALGELHVVVRLGSGGDTMTRFEGRVVTGEEVQGVLAERHDADGRLVEAMLTLRPYAGLRAAMRAMQPLLEASPLPSSS